jgi:hypothetical protein
MERQTKRPLIQLLIFAEFSFKRALLPQITRFFKIEKPTHKDLRNIFSIIGEWGICANLAVEIFSN